MKWDFGLFEDGGVVETEGLDERLCDDSFRAVDDEAAERVIRLIRDKDGILPLSSESKILVVDRITPQQLYQNDSWTHPGMLWDYMLEHNDNVAYVDYTPNNIARTEAIIEQLAPQADIILATGMYSRSVSFDSKPFLASLKRFGKPLVLISSTHYELVVPDEIGTVVVSYGLLRSSLKAVSKFLFGKNDTGK